jgi:hypothetical protein
MHRAPPITQMKCTARSIFSIEKVPVLAAEFLKIEVRQNLLVCELVKYKQIESRASVLLDEIILPRPDNQ